MTSRHSLLNALLPTLIAWTTSVAVQSPAYAAPPAADAAAGVLAQTEDASVVRLGEGTTLTVAPGARIKRLPPVDLNLRSHGHIRVPAFQLDSGRVDVAIEPRPDASRRPRSSPVFIRGAFDGFVIAAQGTVSVVAEGRSLAALPYTGEVLMGTSKMIRTLPLGEIQLLERGQNLRALPPAPTPTIVDAPRVGAWGGNHGLPVDLTWLPAERAVRYRVRVLRDGSPEPVLDTEVDNAGIRIGGEQVPPGAYHVDVRSIDARGFQGNPTAPVAITLVGLLLPQGAYTDDAMRVLVVGGQRVKLSHASSLELSHGGRGPWVPVPEWVGLRHGAQSSFLLRQHGTDMPISFVVAPRDAQADVTIGPGTAVWPRDQVTVKVRITGAARDVIEPRTSVRVGMRPIGVSWTRVGDTLQGVVPPLAGSGGCVVRVEVRDQFGIVLGQESLEVLRSN